MGAGNLREGEDRKAEMRIFAERFWEAAEKRREELGLRAGAVSARMGVPQSYYSTARDRLSIPNAYHLFKMAEALETTTTTLTGADLSPAAQQIADLLSGQPESVQQQAVELARILLSDKE